MVSMCPGVLVYGVGVIPCDTEGLWHLQRRYQSFPIYWCNFVDAEPRADQNYGGFENSIAGFRRSHEAILVYIWAVSGRINSHIRLVSIG